MTSLKDKGYECEELGAKYSYVDVKEAVEKFEKELNNFGGSAFTPQFNEIIKHLKQHYKKVFGDFENDL